VNGEIIEAAKAKLGADLCDALSGKLADEMLQTFQDKLARLERGDLQIGDDVIWSFEPRGEKRTNNSPRSPSAPRRSTHNGGYNLNRHDVTPAKLDELRALMGRCLDAKG
jgi:hypothetical protein